jgi:uncharacterized protein (DUF58 family)
MPSKPTFLLKTYLKKFFQTLKLQRISIVGEDSLLTSAVTKSLGIFFVVFFAAMFLGNVILLYVSIVPFLVVFFSLMFDTPGDIKLERKETKFTAWVDGNLDVSVKVTADKGVGLISLADTLPEHFELLDGSNFRVFWKDPKLVSEELNYRAKCTKRGIYKIGPCSCECRHVLGFQQTGIYVDKETPELVVRHKPLNIKRLRDPKLFSRIPMPLGSMSKLGMMTNDFKEIREYVSGDSYRHVNWKATARASSPMRDTLLVNEFEKEGKKVVWIFLDSSTKMATGTKIENAFEYALQAVQSFSQFYLARNCHVGLCVYNGPEKTVIPDLGRRQEYKIYRTTLGLEVSNTKDPLKRAVTKCRGHLVGGNPFSIIISNVRRENLRELLDGTRELRKYSRSIGRQPQILILHLDGYSIAAEGFNEEAGAAMLNLANQSSFRALRRAGLYVASWNPKRQSLASLMVLGMKRR